jgi:hypothetical protein
MDKFNHMIDDINFMLKRYPSYLCVYEGMGNYTIFRRKSNKSKLEMLQVDNDDYIYNNMTKEQVDNFIKDYQEVNTMKEFNVILYNQ